MTTNRRRLTAEDAGCWLDSWRGVYMVDGIVDFAREFGMQVEHPADCPGAHNDTSFGSEFAGCEFASEFEDEAVDYLNRFAPPHFYFGRNDDGDFGLWHDGYERERGADDGVEYGHPGDRLKGID